MYFTVSKTMCQVVAYQRFLKNSRKFSNCQVKKWSRSLAVVVVYERFQYKALTENIFGVLVFSSFSIVVTYVPCENTWKKSAQLQ